MMKHEALERTQKDGGLSSSLMSQIYSETNQHLVGKTSIAWFKIADVIARGEKERTLSIYRLLVHSINHEAINAQLEGDILRAFNDHNAVNAYLKAAELYKKNKEHALAALLHETVVIIFLTAGRPFERAVLQRSIAAVVDFYREYDDARLSAFLAKLAALDEQAYGYAKSLLQ